MANRKRTRINSKITQLPDGIKEQLDAQLLDTSNSYSDIETWLKSQGYNISKSAVGRYAIRANKAAQRVVETLERTKAIAVAVDKSPDLDFTKASRMVMMDGLMQRVSTAEEDFAEMPLDKAGRLIASLSRVQVYDDKVKRDYKTKMELAFDGLEEELTKSIKADPQLTKELHSVLQKAREKMLSDD
jgi:nucleoside-triphosphatase THEP1